MSKSQYINYKPDKIDIYSKEKPGPNDSQEKSRVMVALQSRRLFSNEDQDRLGRKIYVLNERVKKMPNEKIVQLIRYWLFH